MGRRDKAAWNVRKEIEVPRGPGSLARKDTIWFNMKTMKKVSRHPRRMRGECTAGPHSPDKLS